MSLEQPITAIPPGPGAALDVATELPCHVCERPSRYQFSKSEQPYYVCSHCHAAWTPRIDPRVIFTENHSHSDRHEEGFDDFRLRRIDAAYQSTAMDLVDFGCGKAEFVALANQRGRRCRGIDQDTELQLRDVPDSSIDAINMVEVIEHLYSPQEIFAEFHRILRPGGIVHMETSIVDGHEDLREWEYLDPRIGHCLVHSSDSMAALAQRTGFRCIQQNQNVFYFQKSPLDRYISKREGKFVYLSDAIFAAAAEDADESTQLTEVGKRIANLLAHLGPFYFHCGGAGDGLLLMASFYDVQPNSVVVSYPNSQAAMRSFFDAFPALTQVYLLPPHSKLGINELLRTLAHKHSNCRGRGATPRLDYSQEWNEQLDISRDYGIEKRPRWARPQAGACESKHIAVAPQGSLVGMAGTKRNLIEPRDWLPLLDFLKQRGWLPVIVGTPNERETYPCPEGCDDQRSYSFRDQMDQIAGCALFVGADSWAKSFAALTGMPTYVFDAIKGGDWKGLKDPSDFVFLDPWDCLQVVSGLEAFKDCLTRTQHRIPGLSSPSGNSKQTVHVGWEGTFADNGSLSHVNRELTHALARQTGMEVVSVGTGHRAQAPTRTQVTVRHAWPPNWQAPKHGHWVLIQPWEYGTLPLEWVGQLAGVTEIWVPSEYVRRVYVDSGVAPAKVHVVPNGIDPDRFRPGVTPIPLATKKAFKFLFVGGTIHRKGPDLLLKAFLESFTATDDVCLVIKDFGGSGVYSGQTLQEQIRAAQSAKSAPEIIYLTDELAADAVPGLYAACDCLIHPYRGEGFALPVLEAMACGLPVIVTAGGATDDFATEDCVYQISANRKRIGYRVGPFTLARPGWLLEPSFGELKQRMRWVLEHRDEARAKGKKASELVRRDWTWDRAAKVAAQRLRAIAAVPSAPIRKKSVAIELPAVGRIGNLTEALELFRKKHYREAWDATLKSIKDRPFHPDAHALLKKIKKTAGAIVPSLPEGNDALRLTVCLIVKNEEKFLARCLNSVRDIASQIVVVDTGSTDRTKLIAQEHGAELYDFKWNDDFSSARNAALEHARGDWVLVLDADEELSVDGREQIRRDMGVAKVLAYRLPIVDIGKEEEGCHYVPRLFRNAPGLFFVGRIHEQVFSSIEVRRKQWGMENEFSTAALVHHGYTTEVVAERNKLSRNLRLLEQALQEMPDEPNLLMNYGLELARAGRQQMAVDQYLEAFRIMQTLPEDQVAPELREALLTQLCTQLTAAHQYETLIRLLQSPLARRGGLTASLHFGWGLACLQLQQFEDAMEHFRQCLALRDRPSLTPVNRDIRKAAPHHCVAICLFRLGRIDEATEAFRQALAVDPQSRPARFDFATFLGSRNQGVDALKILHELVTEKADDLPAWLLGAHIALKQPQLLEFACQWTGEGMKVFPQDKMLTLQRAEALTLTSHVEEALPLWQLAGTPGNPAHRAAQMLCELASSGVISTKIAPQDDTAVSKEFIQWYQRLLRAGMTPTLTRMNERIATLKDVLPTAGRTLESALAATQPVCG